MKISRDEFKEEDVVLCTIDDERCNDLHDCSECEKAKREMMSFDEIILERVMPKNELPADHPFHGGVANENMTIVKYTDNPVPYHRLGCTKDDFVIIITPEEMRLEESYPEFHKLMKYSGIGTPSYYLLRNHRWPMIAVYVRKEGDSYYIVAPVTDGPVDIKAEKATACTP